MNRDEQKDEQTEQEKDERMKDEEDRKRGVWGGGRGGPS